MTGATGAGGEIGHIHVEDNETEECGCGNYGCLEEYASATGITRLAKRALSLPELPRLHRYHLLRASRLAVKWEIPTRTAGNGKDILPDIAASIRGKMEEKQLGKGDVAGVGIGVPGPGIASSSFAFTASKTVLAEIEMGIRLKMCRSGSGI